MIKRSLETKIIAVLGLVLTTVLSLYALYDIAYEREGTYHMVYQQLEVLTNTIQKSLIKDMRSGKGSDVQEILEIVGTEPGILAVRIFDEDGRILKSGKRSEVGQAVPGELLEMYKAGKRDFVTEGDRRVIHIVHPIANAPQCNGCHGKVKEIIGVLSLDYSLVSVENYIVSHTRQLGAVLGATLMMVGLLIFFLLKRMVSDPIVKLQSAMAAAEDGNLDMKIEVDTNDEVGSLKESFNRMLSRIKGLNEKNLSQQRAILEKEQELRIGEQLAEKNAELESANREVLEKNRYYMEMLSFISHELKNPLVVLKGYTSMLAAEDLGKLEDQQREAVYAMDRNVDALNEMISNYMDLSRLERGELVPQKRVFPVVDEIVKPLMLEFSDALAKSAMSMRIECSEEGLRLAADPSLMKSVLGNLLSNAIKYGRPGTDIIVEVGRSEAGVRISVFNEGEGIPAGQREQIFGRFSRLDNEVTRSRKGSGLGLYLVRTIIGLHGGEVAAESKEGEWARIVCDIPAAGGEAEPG